MQELIISKTYSENFVKDFLCDYCKQLAIDELLKNKNSAAVRYIEKNYKCSIHDIIKILSVIKIETYKNFYKITYDTDYKIKNNYNAKNILKFLSSGNLEVKGIRLIDNTFEFTRQHIKTLYTMYLRESLQLDVKEPRINGHKIL